MRYRSYNNGGNFFWTGLFIFLAFGGFKTLFLLLPILSLTPIIIFGFLGYRVLKSISHNNTIRNNINTSNTERLHYVELMVQLMVHGIQADGKIDQREIQALLAFFQNRLRFNTQHIYWVQDLLQHAMQRPTPLQQIYSSMNREFKANEKQLALELLIAILIADDTLTTEESQLLDQTAQHLNIDPSFYAHLKQRHQTQTNSHHDILGVPQSASSTDIKKAYKELCKKYHPDKVQHLGDEFKQFAEDKIKEINKAYDALSKTVKV